MKPKRETELQRERRLWKVRQEMLTKCCHTCTHLLKPESRVVDYMGDSLCPACAGRKIASLWEQVQKMDREKKDIRSMMFSVDMKIRKLAELW